ncbi:MAG: hypothetical protein HY537_00945 [Deltaproteobacteria bacterium]|nr:hypothetical protein [Deltaproteobacteria bacterium]
MFSRFNTAIFSGFLVSLFCAAVWGPTAFAQVSEKPGKQRASVWLGPSLEELDAERARCQRYKQYHREGQPDTRLQSKLAETIYEAFKIARSPNLDSRKYPEPSISDAQLKALVNHWLPGEHPSGDVLDAMFIDFLEAVGDEGEPLFDLSVFPSLTEFQDDSFWTKALGRRLGNWETLKSNSRRHAVYMLTVHTVFDLFNRYDRKAGNVPSSEHIEDMRNALRNLYVGKLEVEELSAYPRRMFLKLGAALGDPAAYQSSAPVLREVLKGNKKINHPDVFAALRALKLLGATKIGDLDRDGTVRRAASNLLREVLKQFPDNIIEDILSRNISYDSFR